MATGYITAGNNPFNDWYQSEVRGYSINYAARLAGGESGSAFAVHVPAGFSALASGYNQSYSSWVISEVTSSALQSGSANITMRLSATGVVTASAYIVSATMITNSANVYIESFKVYTYGGHA